MEQAPDEQNAADKSAPSSKLPSGGTDDLLTKAAGELLRNKGRSSR